MAVWYGSIALDLGRFDCTLIIQGMEENWPVYSIVRDHSSMSFFEEVSE